MNKIENNAGYIEFMITSLPKKNHGALLQLEKKSTDMFRRESIEYNLFLFSNNTNCEGFTNISKTIYPGIDEEVWINMLVQIDYR